jgi:hypothetical protein
MAADVDTYLLSCADYGMTILFTLACPEIGMLLEYWDR